MAPAIGAIIGTLVDVVEGAAAVLGITSIGSSVVAAFALSKVASMLSPSRPKSGGLSQQHVGSVDDILFDIE